MRRSKMLGLSGALLSVSTLVALAAAQPCPCPATVTTYPYAEDFEEDLGLWQNGEGDDFDWDRYQGSTPTDNTGPEADHTLGTEDGYYVYTEASGDNNPEKTAILTGPCFDLAPLASPQLSFWYSLAGDSMGSLYVEISAADCATWDLVYSLIGHQGWDWRLAVIDLSSYAGQTITVRFRGVTGDGYESDMALDDIYVGEAVAYQGGCCNLDTGACLGLLTEAECQSYGHVAWYLVTDCSEDNFCPQPPPANDLCENAIEVDTLPFTDPQVDYKWATPDVGVSCDDEACTESQYGVWYKYTTTEYCGARITVAPSEGGWSVLIGVFTGTGCGDLTEIQCASGYGAEATFDVAAGTTYWILVGSFWCGAQPSATISVTLNCSLGACCLGATCSLETVTSCAAQNGYYLGDETTCTPDVCLYGACCTATGCQQLTSDDCSAASGTFLGNGTTCWPDPCPPINENCATAIPITDGTPAIEGTNALASEEDDTEDTCSWSNKDLWYAYTATCTGTVTVDTEGSGQENTVLSVWDACGGTEIACDDDSGTDSLSYLTFEAIAGRTYQIRLASFAWIGGDFDINIACTEAPQGACCVGGACVLDYRLTCEAAGGMYAGDGTACPASDCNGNGVDDLCDVLSGTSADCNANGIPDECDIASAASLDRDANGVPDECDPDCNGNGIIDGCDVKCTGGCASISGCGQSADCQGDGIPDECQLIIPGCDGVRYDSGFADLVNGVRPDSGWWYVGIADDFTLDEAVEGTCLRLDMFDTVGSGNLTTLRVRIYANPNGLLNLGSFAAATPVFDQTYTTSDGSLTIKDTGEDLYYYDLLRFQATGPAYSLAAGSYALHVSFPGTWDAGFWATSGTDDSDCAVYWGDWVDSPSDACAGGDNLTKLSFALLGTRNNDCNGNAVPDECDIATGYSHDYNHNGTPDECDPVCGDVTGDQQANAEDYYLLRNAFGRCSGDELYLPAADLDGDGCITLVDYQQWLVCYHMATGRQFVVPIKKPYRLQTSGVLQPDQVQR